MFAVSLSSTTIPSISLVMPLSSIAVGTTIIVGTATLTLFVSSPLSLKSRQYLHPGTLFALAASMHIGYDSLPSSMLGIRPSFCQRLLGL